MPFKSIPWLLWFIPVALLLAATARLPYGYYTFTRVVVCGSALYIAIAGWNEFKIWSAIFGLVAILFNPILPVYLHRGTWLYFDVGVAVIFAAHLIFVRSLAPAIR
jgi:hypothetical protein